MSYTLQTTSTQTNGNKITRDIKYINKDFTDFRNKLIEFAKTYFPTTHTDFTPSSPGMMFIEMASYVGDVLSFYQDNQIQENFIQYVRQQNNLYDLAYMFGYQPSVTGVSTVEVELYQTVPATGNNPDFDYALNVPENTVINSNQNNITPFLILDRCDFTVSSSQDPTDISIYEVDGGGNPTYFLLKKTRTAISATQKTQDFTFSTPQRFSTITIEDNNIVKIDSCVDSDGNEWYEVPYLAQETVLDSLKNQNPFGEDPNYSSSVNDVPYLLRLKKVARRFVSRFKSPTQLQIQFGAGSSADSDEEIIPNPNNVGIGLPFTQDKLKTAFAPSNFLFTQTYGIAPSSTTLTFTYTVGGGVGANVPANSLNSLNTSNVTFLKQNLDPTVAQTAFDSLEVNNPKAASGGADGDSPEEIRQNTLEMFSSQLRSVTQDDYLVRALSMPSEYGSLSKIYVEKQNVENLNIGEIPSTLDFCVLAYNQNKQLVTASDALKNNLSTYLSQYRMIGDSLRIKDAFIINIAVEFEIITLPNYNSNTTLLKCITALQNYFNIDNWQINQPILLRDIYVLLDRIEGVQTVKVVNIINKAGESLGYSQYAYDIPGATLNNIVYPSLDTSIFEVKYPNTDISGKVVNF
jgi:hypothetical protein